MKKRFYVLGKWDTAAPATARNSVLKAKMNYMKILKVTLKL
jgi:hypothetical protein